MTIKICPCCKEKLTTRNVEKVSVTHDLGSKILWFTCKACKSTAILQAKKKAG